MKLIKKINNNFAIAKDGNGEQIIVNGKGIGLVKMPCELDDYSMVERTFYNISSENYVLIKSVSNDVMEVIPSLMNLIESNLFVELNPNLFFILADHINFVIKRNKINMVINYPPVVELEQIYPVETKLGYRILDKIQEKLNIMIDKSECYGITMNIINAEVENVYAIKKERNQKTVLKITNIIENEFNIKLNKTSYIYKRFSKHMLFLLIRIQNGEQLKSNMRKTRNSLSSDFYLEYCCAIKITEFLNSEFKCFIEKEEFVYIVYHLNCLMSRFKNIE